MIKDGLGFYGALFTYAFLIALLGSTLLVFFYVWKKGNLSMGEEVKYKMMEKEDEPRRD